MTITIAGGGIAGLTLGISCHQAGIPFRIFEKVSLVRPLGVGINLQPHAVRELSEMGLMDRLLRTGIPLSDINYFSKRGNKIWNEPRGMLAGYRWPQVAVHRGLFQKMLLDALIDMAGPDCIATGHEVTGFEDHADGVTVNVRSSDGVSQSLRSRLLVAADGIHSTIRAQLYPDEGAPLWGGAVLWRGITQATPFLSGSSMATYGHERQKFVTYPISTVGENGHATINWIAELKFEPDQGWNREDYSRAGDFDDFLPKFEDWNFSHLDIPGVIRECTKCYEYPMVDRDPLKRWTFGNVTLAGDAAHAMYPIGSNGASQGILDARVLTREICAHGLTPDAFAAYEQERRPATTVLVDSNRGNGPDQVLQIVEEKSDGEFRNISEVLSQAELESIASEYKKIAGMSIETLNARAPIVEPGLRLRPKTV